MAGEPSRISIGWVRCDTISGMIMTRLLLTKSGQNGKV